MRALTDINLNSNAGFPPIRRFVVTGISGIQIEFYLEASFFISYLSFPDVW